MCVHHWIIAPPEGPTSMGICRHCGAGKVFENWKRTGFMEMDMDAGVSKPIKDLMYENSRGINM